MCVCVRVCVPRARDGVYAACVHAHAARCVSLVCPRRVTDVYTSLHVCAFVTVHVCACVGDYAQPVCTCLHVYSVVYCQRLCR